MRFSSLVAAAAVSRAAGAAASYGLVDDYSGSNFFGMFDFFTGPDPTQGFVSYVDQGSAQAQGLINTNGGQAYIGVDHSNVAGSGGRASVRLSSKKSYTHMLVVLDLAHMPGGECGTWPAFWTLGPNWPNGGEIDIIEGVNGQTTNFMTLHTSPNCALTGGGSGAAGQGQAVLSPVTDNCDTNVDGNVGCSFHDDDSSFYGQGFNAQGGGVFAMEWTSQGVNIWRWHHGSVPSDALGDSPNPSNWGRASSTFGGGGCDWDAHLSSHQLVFDTTFCGAWAGAQGVWDSCAAANGGQTCQAFVQNNPGAFQDAYWSVNSLRVYQNNGASQSNTNNNGSPEPSPAKPQPVVPNSAKASSSTTQKPSQPASAPTPTPTPAKHSPSPPAPPLSHHHHHHHHPSFTTITMVPRPSPASSSSSSPAAEETLIPLDSSDFGQGSKGIPAKEKRMAKSEAEAEAEAAAAAAAEAEAEAEAAEAVQDPPSDHMEPAGSHAQIGRRHLQSHLRFGAKYRV